MTSQDILKNKETESKITYYKWALLIWFSSQVFSVGLIQGVIGPTLTELTWKFQTTYDAIAYAIGTKGFGALIGGPLGGLLFDHLQQHLLLVLIFILILKAVIVSSIPYCTTVWAMGILWGSVGICYTVVEVAGKAYMLALWKERAAGPMLFTFSMRSLAKIIAPFIFVPFVSESAISSNSSILGRSTQESLTGENDINIIYVTNQSSGRTQNAYHYDGMVSYAYLICGISVIVVAAVLSIINVCSISVRKTIDIKEENKTSKKPNISTQHVSRPFCVYITTVMSLFAVAANLTNHASADFMFSVSILKSLNFTYEQAEILTSVQFIAAIIGQLSSILILNFCSVLLLQNVVLFLSVITGIVMTFFGLYGYTYFWINTVLFFFVTGPIIPLTFPYINSLYPVNGMLVGIFSIGFGTGRIMANWITGVVFQYHGSRAVLMELTISQAVCFVISIITYLVWLKIRQEPKDEDESDYETAMLFDTSDSD